MATSPISEAQLAANRANAQHSTGPATAQAKSRTRLNSLRHGLTGQTVLLPDEDRAAYDRHHAEYRDALKPKGVIETQLAHQIADSYWRLNRIRAIENNIFALGIEAHAGEFRDDPEDDAALSQAQTYLEQSRELNLLSLYEQRINRGLLSLNKEYARIQSERWAAAARREQDRRDAESVKAPEEYGFLDENDIPKVSNLHGDHGFGFSNPKQDNLSNFPDAPKSPKSTSEESPIAQAA